MATHAAHNTYAFSYSLGRDEEDVDSTFLVAEVCITFKSCAMGQRIFMAKKKRQYKKKKATNKWDADFHTEVICTLWGRI